MNHYSKLESTVPVFLFCGLTSKTEFHCMPLVFLNKIEGCVLRIKQDLHTLFIFIQNTDSPPEWHVLRRAVAHHVTYSVIAQ